MPVEVARVPGAATDLILSLPESGQTWSVPVRSSVQKPAVSQVSFVFVFTFCCTL